MCAMLEIRLPRGAFDVGMGPHSIARAKRVEGLWIVLPWRFLRWFAAEGVGINLPPFLRVCGTAQYFL